MASTVKAPFDAGDSDAARAAELSRIKALATAVLAGALALLIVAKSLSAKHPAFGFAAAFAEAAVIGGLADWYAVVALFRRPMGLPIPHTAVIQRNQARIGDKIGEFIEVHFLSPAPVDAKLREIDFAAFISDWLCDSKRSAALARFVLRLLPEAMSAAETSGLRTFLVARFAEQLQSVNIAPFAAGTLRSFIDEGRHQSLFGDLLSVVNGALNKPETLAAIREKIRSELPTLLNLYAADAYLMNKIVASATNFFDEVRDDKDHPFRAEFHRMAVSFIDRLENDPAYAGRLDALKRDLLARPELSDLALSLWSNLRSFIEQSAADETSGLAAHLAGLFAKAGAQLASDPDLRAEVNRGCVLVLRSFIVDQKRGVSTFIADQVKAWDMKQLVALLELNVGKDLQYIRFNGTLIGGLAGLALYTAEYVFRLL